MHLKKMVFPYFQYKYFFRLRVCHSDSLNYKFILRKILSPGIVASFLWHFEIIRLPKSFR